MDAEPAVNPCCPYVPVAGSCTGCAGDADEASEDGANESRNWVMLLVRDCVAAGPSNSEHSCEKQHNMVSVACSVTSCTEWQQQLDIKFAFLRVMAA